MRELDRKVRDLTHETIAHIGPEIYYALMEYAFRGHNGLFLSLSHVPAYGGAKNGRSGEDNRKWLMSNLRRSEEHTSELQSLMRISYAVFCLKKKKIKAITQK